MKYVPTKTLKFCVYKITNSISNKSYIGKTLDLQKRWKGHLNGSKDLEITTKFPNALRKYSEDNWIVSVLYETDDETHCYEVEASLVDDYDTFYNGYNSDGGGKGFSSGKKHSRYGKKREHSEETKRKLSIAKSGENHPLFGALPWNMPSCISNGLEINWYYLDKVYDLRIQNPSYYGQSRIYNKLVKDYPDIQKSPTSFQSMFKWIKKNGNPKNNKDWLDFHNKFTSFH